MPPVSDRADDTQPPSPPSRAVEAAVELAGAPSPSPLIDAERELDQQAGIVTAANAAVSGHTGPTGAHGVLPGVLADVRDRYPQVWLAVSATTTDLVGASPGVV